MSAPEVQRMPNIIMVVVDDLGWRDLGCYGSSFYETPVLDRLARQGALLTDAYAASPVCSPSRASLLTGRLPARVGVTQFIGGHGVGRLADVPRHEFLPSQERTYARALREAGYHTWHVGKWHLGGRDTWPDRHGFDVNIGGCSWGLPDSYFSPYQCPALSDGPVGEYLTDRLTDEAIALIRSAERPYLLNLWHYAVHTPIEAPTALVEKYRAKADAFGLSELEPFVDGEAFPVWHKRHQRVRRRRLQSDPAYAAMIENLDSNIGRLLDAVDQAGQADNTLVVVTSDNGGLATAEGSPTSNRPLAEGKGWSYDGGMRVPLLIRWPGTVPAGVRIDEPVIGADLFPTLLSAAGVPLPSTPPVDGVDLGPLLRGTPFRRGPIWWHYPHYSNQGGTPAAAIRDGRWKLVRSFEDDRCELYDLHTDPGEQHNVASHASEQRAQLQQQLETYLDEVAATLPVPNPLPAWKDLPG